MTVSLKKTVCPVYGQVPDAGGPGSNPPAACAMQVMGVRRYGTRLDVE